jgi:hypothetical protein
MTSSSQHRSRSCVPRPLGAHDLYVALTRATRSLHVVTAEAQLDVLSVLDDADAR